MSRSRRRATAPPDTDPCPCGSPRPYGRCCGPLHRGESAASTAEALMRSRYSAFAVGDAAYLMRTWAAGTRPATLELDPRTEWVRLEILGTGEGTPFHHEGTVSFRAVYREDGHEGELRENSRFVREDGAWVYLDALA
ncbi:YchJ family protein [Nocardiopsis aegyptia]|uniref:UPF0225 protein HNR10_000233 n=1 Tax=Nocardiopsis aegyptia TaxID=220378 RepID=A0A7Z0EI26_9ACTN|nr:YchJ family metal-binding protein [Nocardiopsis aegyptia]NYJ32352.1 SEC-C motif-containing protein [Nocardiopsis aegyptia]